MKKTFLTYVVAFIAMLTFYSCGNNTISGVFDTPFPLDEINAYFDLPFDSVTFVSNMGDTVRCALEKEPYRFTPYKPHKWEGDEPEGEEGEEDEIEIGDELPESYGIEDFVNTIHYLNGGEKFLEYKISLFERYDLICIAELYEKEFVKHEFWKKRVQFTKPSNEIFNFLKDTMVLDIDLHLLPNNPALDPTAYAILVRGKGITKFIRRDGIETWHMLESEGHR